MEPIEGLVNQWDVFQLKSYIINHWIPSLYITGCDLGAETLCFSIQVTTYKYMLLNAQTCNITSNILSEFHSSLANANPSWNSLHTFDRKPIRNMSLLPQHNNVHVSKTNLEAREIM